MIERERGQPARVKGRECVGVRANEEEICTADGPDASERNRGGGWGSGRSRRHTTSPQVAALLSCELNNDIKMWFVHVLVGDGINTNEAAARRLLARALVEPMGQLRYLLAAHKRSSHQATLAAKTAVIGAAARVAAATGADSDMVGQSLTWQFVERPHASISA